MNDLFDQLLYLQKLPSQSMKSYLEKAKSLLYALESMRGFLNELEFTNFLVKGLVIVFSKEFIFIMIGCTFPLIL